MNDYIKGLKCAIEQVETEIDIHNRFLILTERERFIAISALENAKALINDEIIITEHEEKKKI